MVESVGTPWLWAGFVALVAALLALDLGVFHRRDHAVGAREALVWTGVWVGLALLFDAALWWRFGADRAIEFLTGYLIEKSLSVDNLFVFALVFGALAIPARHQHRVLFWGILGALVLRAGMIVGGAALVARFHALVYVFGAFLLLTGVRLFAARGDAPPHPERSWAFRLLRRAIPSTSRLHGHAFFAREVGRLVATPLFLALALVELSDVVFAVDSIPAIFGVTLDPFIVFTSNIFAILGLRSLYFAMARLLDRLAYLKPALAAVLVFIGAKMLASRWVDVGALASLAVVVAILGGAVLLSLARPRAAAAVVARAPEEGG
jgi:tellurite resistance protein TerC